MKQVTWTITENTPLTPDTYRLRLAGDTEAITAPGQFVNLKLSGFYLRRPISVCDWEPGAATLIYKVLGHGTAAMTHLPAGTELDIRLILEEKEIHPEITVTFFVPDEKKDGGAYVTASGHIKRVDEAEQLLILEEGDKIPMEDIYEISRV